MIVVPWTQDAILYKKEEHAALMPDKSKLFRCQEGHQLNKSGFHLFDCFFHFGQLIGEVYNQTSDFLLSLNGESQKTEGSVGLTSSKRPKAQQDGGSHYSLNRHRLRNRAERAFS